MTSKKIEFLIIDPQNDFSDPNGTLFVPGAQEDMLRLADLLNRIKSKISDIHVTLDSHHLLHIANPIFWRNSNGDNPAPFTCITVKDVESGKWTTRMPSHYKRALDYLRALEKGGRYPHVIWPPHCLIGSWGTGIVPSVFNAVKAWEEEFAVADMITKGSNLWTEHFSGIKAEVPDPSDPSTQINTSVVSALEKADEIVVVGEALSHCLANTARDVVDNFPNTNRDSYVKKLVILKDCASSVPGFEKLGEDFLKEMEAKGATITTSDKYLR